MPTQEEIKQIEELKAKGYIEASAASQSRSEYAAGSGQYGYAEVDKGVVLIKSAPVNVGGKTYVEPYRYHEGDWKFKYDVVNAGATVGGRYYSAGEIAGIREEMRGGSFEQGALRVERREEATKAQKQIEREKALRAREKTYSYDPNTGNIIANETGRVVKTKSFTGAIGGREAARRSFEESIGYNRPTYEEQTATVVAKKKFMPGGAPSKVEHGITRLSDEDKYGAESLQMSVEGWGREETGFDIFDESKRGDNIYVKINSEYAKMYRGQIEQVLNENQKSTPYAEVKWLSPNEYIIKQIRNTNNNMVSENLKTGEVSVYQPPEEELSAYLPENFSQISDTSQYWMQNASYVPGKEPLVSTPTNQSLVSGSEVKTVLLKNASINKEIDRINKENMERFDKEFEKFYNLTSKPGAVLAESRSGGKIYYEPHELTKDELKNEIIGGKQFGVEIGTQGAAMTLQNSSTAQIKSINIEGKTFFYAPEGTTLTMEFSKDLDRQSEKFRQKYLKDVKSREGATVIDSVLAETQLAAFNAIPLELTKSGLGFMSSWQANYGYQTLTKKINEGQQLTEQEYEAYKAFDKDFVYGTSDEFIRYSRIIAGKQIFSAVGKAGEFVGGIGTKIPSLTQQAGTNIPARYLAQEAGRQTAQQIFTGATVGASFVLGGIEPSGGFNVEKGAGTALFVGGSIIAADIALKGGALLGRKLTMKSQEINSRFDAGKFNYNPKDASLVDKVISKGYSVSAKYGGKGLLKLTTEQQNVPVAKGYAMQKSGRINIYEMQFSKNQAETESARLFNEIRGLQQIRNKDWYQRQQLLSLQKQFAQYAAPKEQTTKVIRFEGNNQYGVKGALELRYQYKYNPTTGSLNRVNLGSGFKSYESPKTTIIKTVNYFRKNPYKLIPESKTYKGQINPFADTNNQPIRGGSMIRTATPINMNVQTVSSSLSYAPTITFAPISSIFRTESPSTTKIQTPRVMQQKQTTISQPITQKSTSTLRFNQKSLLSQKAISGVNQRKSLKQDINSIINQSLNQNINQNVNQNINQNINTNINQNVNTNINTMTNVMQNVNVNTNVRTRVLAPPKAPPMIFMPTPFLFGKSKRKRKSAPSKKRGYAYTPSLTAAMFNIKSPKMGDVRGGVFLRPILTKKKKKKKRGKK